MDAAEAVALALHYLEGLRATGTETARDEAEAFMAHLAGSGYAVRGRERAEWRRRRPTVWEARSITPVELRARREALGLSLGDMARRIRMVPVDVAAIETGRVAPHLKTLDRIIAALHHLEEAGRADHQAARADDQDAAAPSLTTSGNGTARRQRPRKPG